MSYKYTYYTCLTNNIDSRITDTTIEPNLQFNEMRENPIITNTKDYDVCITNFKLDTKTLPSFIPIIKYNNSQNLSDRQKNTTIYELTYSVTVNGTTYSHTQPIYFKPQDTTISSSPPEFINGSANYKSGYYNIYNYENFFTLLNTALRSAILGLQSTYDSYHGNNAFNVRFGDSTQTSFNNFQIPSIIFDKDTKLAYINAPVKNFDNTSSNCLSLYFNAPLYRLLDSLPFTKIILNSSTRDSATGLPIQKQQELFKLNFNNFENSNVISLYPKTYLQNSVQTVKVDHYLIYQDYETLTSWSPVESIVLASSTLPIAATIVSQNHTYIQGQETTEGSSNIIEMEMADFRGSELKPGIIYDPKILRWINLRDMSELKNISFQVLFRLKIDGQLIPLKINSGGSFGLKLCFRKPK